MLARISLLTTLAASVTAGTIDFPEWIGYQGDVSVKSFTYPSRCDADCQPVKDAFGMCQNPDERCRDAICATDVAGSFTKCNLCTGMSPNAANKSARDLELGCVVDQSMFNRAAALTIPLAFVCIATAAAAALYM